MSRRSAAAFALAEPDIDAAPVALTPERQRLADAIEAVRNLEADAAATSGEIDKAVSMRSTASRTLEEAERQLERSKPRPASKFERPLRSPGAFWSPEQHEAHEAAESLPPIPITQAREAVATYADARDSAERAVQFHRDRLQQLQDNLRFRQGSIREAVRGVLRGDPAFADLVAESRRLHTRAAAAAAAVEFVIGGDTLQPDSPSYGFDRPSHHSADFEGWAVSRQWREAVDRLSTDATTPLPTIEPVP